MHKESNEDLFEFLLKSAVIENTLDILEQYPNKETLDSIVVPKSYDDKIKKRVYQQRKKYSIKNIKNHPKNCCCFYNNYEWQLSAVITTSRS